MTRMRVIHAPEAVAGNSPGLANAETEIGLDSEAICLRPHPFGYEGVHVFGERDPSPLAAIFGMLSMFAYVLRNADVLHLNFGRSIFDPGPNVLSRIPRWSGVPFLFSCLQRFEFFCYHLRSIPVVMTYQGDDVRQSDVSLEKYQFSMAQAVEEGYYPAGSDQKKRQRTRFYASRTEHTFFLNPDLQILLDDDSEFLAYTSVDPRDWSYQEKEPDEIRHLVHAPSHRGTKGTEYLLQAVEMLQSEGIPFRFTMVEGMSREEAAQVYEQADLVVDQLLAGWYGGLAVECMALGKPVIAYLRRSDFGALPDGMVEDLPFIEANPDMIAEVLRDWLQRPANELKEKGRKGRAFVEKWHDPIKIAERMRQVYESVLPEKN